MEFIEEDLMVILPIVAMAIVIIFYLMFHKRFVSKIGEKRYNLLRLIFTPFALGFFTCMYMSNYEGKGTLYHIAMLVVFITFSANIFMSFNKAFKS
jgi:hypothetical protein